MFSERLAALMAERNLKQVELSEAVSVSPATVFKWLNGTLPRSGELYRLAKFFGRKMEWFLEGEEGTDLTQEEADTIAIEQTEAIKFLRYMRAQGMELNQFEEWMDVLNRINAIKGLPGQKKASEAEGKKRRRKGV